MRVQIINKPYQWAFALVWLSIFVALIVYLLQAAGQATALGMAVLLTISTVVLLATISYLFRWFVFRALLSASGLLLVAYSLLLIWLEESDSAWLIRCIALFFAAFGCATIAIGVRERLR